jgi:hypothetical protein
VEANFTVIPGDANGYLTIYPGASTTTNPVASDVNWIANESPAVPNFTIADTNGTGSVEVYNSHGATINLVVDAFGYFTASTTVPAMVSAVVTPGASGTGTIAVTYNETVSCPTTVDSVQTDFEYTNGGTPAYPSTCSASVDVLTLGTFFTATTGTTGVALVAPVGTDTLVYTAPTTDSLLVSVSGSDPVFAATQTLVVLPPVTPNYTLSAITMTGQAVGTGAAAAPAVSYGAALTASATLTTTSTSTPAAGIDLTLEVAGTGAPTVTSNGFTLSGTPFAGGGGNSYSVPTNASGVAAATLTEPSGVTASYILTYVAPITAANGQLVSDAATYVEFVAAGSVGLSSFGTAAAPFTVAVSTPANEATGLVPVTATLPPLNSSAQVNIEVTFCYGSGYAFWAN